jgi:hypothetical protein
MMTVEQGKKLALDITEAFPEAKTVQEAFDLAREANMFADETEGMIAWGRLMRLLPQAVA